MNIKTSIISSMYNRERKVLEVVDELFLPSLLGNCGQDKELIIIDDCSPLEKETEEVVEKHLAYLGHKFGRVVFERNKKNLGYAKAFNKGVSLATGDKVVIVNDDVYFPPTSIDRLVAVLDASPEVKIAGPVTNAPSVWSFQYCRQAPRPTSYAFKEITKLDKFSRFLWRRFGYAMTSVDILCGFCFAVDRNFFINIGGFDEKFFYGQFEDTNLIEGIKKKYSSQSVGVCNGVFVGHGGPRGTSRTMFQQPIKMQAAFWINGFRFAWRWGFRTWWRRIVFGIRTKCNGQGTISVILPNKVDYQNEVV
jgi:O-antigen biosynthesis protein